MPQHVDQVADKSGAELVRLARLYEFPEFVKTAELTAVMLERPLPVHLYADPVRKQFPCDTRESTWMSHLYYQEKAAEFHEKDRGHIENRLAGYARYWGIESDCHRIKDRWHGLHKTAEEKLPDTDYAFVRTLENGGKERHLRLKTAADVQAAAVYLETYRDQFPYVVRHDIAKRILTKAAHFGAAITGQRDFLERQAGMGVCDPAEVVRMIKYRAALLPEVKSHQLKTAEETPQAVNDLRAAFLKMAETVQRAPSTALQPDMLVKLAMTIDMLDRSEGFTYANGLQRPEDVIFKVTFSKAGGDLQQHTATTSGKVYEKIAFRKLAVTDLEALFGTEFADRVSGPLGDVDPEKMAEEVSALPRPDAELLDTLLSDNGISPVLTKAASAKQGMSQEEMQYWAKAYQSVG